MYISANFIVPFVSLISLATAHSWLGCTSFNNTNLIEWMQGNATESNGAKILDAVQTEWAYLCAGWPRAKRNPGNWIAESSDYLWAPGKKGDTHACHPDQRTPIQYLTPMLPDKPDQHAPAPMATARAGGNIQLMYGGNGHSRGNFGGVDTHDPGKVSVYWAGEKEKEIVDVSELTPDLLVQENGFSDESYIWPPDKSVTSGPGFKDKGNWQTVRL
jgi:hypothetical protein